LASCTGWIFYEPADFADHHSPLGEILNIQMDEGGAEEIAGRCRGTPRIANRPAAARARFCGSARGGPHHARGGEEALQSWASTRAAWTRWTAT